MSCLAVSLPDYSIQILNTDTYSVVHVLLGHLDEVTSCVFSPDDSRLASSSLDNTIRIWDVLEGVDLMIMSVDHPVFNIEFHVSLDMLLICRARKNVYHDQNACWILSLPDQRRSELSEACTMFYNFDWTKAITSSNYYDDGKMYVILKVFDARSAVRIGQFTLTGNITLAASPVEDMVALVTLAPNKSCSTMSLVDILSGESIRTLGTHSSRNFVTFLAFILGGTHVVSCCRRMAVVHECSTSAIILTIKFAFEACSFAVNHPNYQTAVGHCEQDSVDVTIFSLNTGDIVRRLVKLDKYFAFSNSVGTILL
jgi:WD40 repeat protein